VNKMDLAVGVLTYGERNHLLYPVIDRLLEQGLNVIYVYCNGIKRSLFGALRERYKNDNVILVYSDENLGSAGGYYKLLEYVAEADCSKFLMLLDDDNLVPNNFTEILKDIDVKDNEILFINRKDRHILVEAKKQKKPWLDIGSKNSFLGHDYFRGLIPAYEEVKGDLLVAPYGGLILQREIIEKAIYPNKSYYLYADDYDYTYRLVTKHGYVIRLIDDLEIEDIETSFHLENKSVGLFSNRYIRAPKIRLYYSVRNQMLFAVNRVDNWLVFGINSVFTSLYINFGFIVRLDFKRVIWFLLAAADAIKIIVTDRTSR